MSDDFTICHYDFEKLPWLTSPRHQLNLQGVALGLINLPPNEGYTFTHQHRKQEEVYIVISGSGSILINDEVIDHTSTNYLNNAWLKVTITINNASALANRSVSLSYSSVNDGDTTASTMRVDDTSLITHCSGIQTFTSSNKFNSQVHIEPVVNRSPSQP